MDSMQSFTNCTGGMVTLMSKCIFESFHHFNVAALMKWLCQTGGGVWHYWGNYKTFLEAMVDFISTYRNNGSRLLQGSKLQVMSVGLQNAISGVKLSRLVSQGFRLQQVNKYPRLAPARRSDLDAKGRVVIT